MKKKISVIIPVYNAEKYVESTVKSVLSQPYENIRIILVNDGSKDNSPQICDHLAENNDRITVLHQANSGVSVARNRGIDYALKNNPQGYIMFLDADDGWTKDFFTPDIVELLEKEYDLIGFQNCRCNSEMNRRGEPTPLKEGEYQGGVKSIWVHSSQHFCAMMYSCKHLKYNNLKFNKALKNNEDRIFTMQCTYLADSIFLKNKLLYLYRNNPSSASKRLPNAIKKFEPMINEYLNLDKAMEVYNETRGTFNEGKAMAGIYVLDLIDEHFQGFGSKRELTEFFASNKHMAELFEHPFIKNYKYQIPERTAEIKDNFRKYILKRRVKGIVLYATNTIYRMAYKTPFKKAIDKMRYPIIIE